MEVSSINIDNEVRMIERFRFDKLRASSVSALKHASLVLAYAEDGQANCPEAYQEMVSLVHALTGGLSDAV